MNREEYLYAPIEYMHDHPPQDLIPICLVSANDLRAYIGLTDPANLNVAFAKAATLNGILLYIDPNLYQEP